jgi:hypothetical protein
MSKHLKSAIQIREDFYDKPHREVKQMSWEWPVCMIEVGDCEAVMYKSNKWQKNGQMIDYKHVSEGPQKLMLREDIVFHGEEEEYFGPAIDLRGEFPKGFAVLANTLSIQARLYSDDEGEKYSCYANLTFPKSKLGAGKFKDGSSFVFVYDRSGVLAVVVGEILDVLKDGIVG